MQNLTNLFLNKFGFNPTSFRAGRFGLSNYTIHFLQKLGYIVDSSVVPYTQWKDGGGYVEFFGAQTEPYFPDFDKIKEPGNSSILEIPITSGKTWYSYLPNKILKTVPQNRKFWRFPRFIFKNKFVPVILRPTFKTGTFENLKSLIDFYIRRNKNKNVFLVMMFHNVDFVPGCSPYAQNEHELSIFLSRLKNILEYVKGLSAEFITLSQVKDIFIQSS